MKVTTVSVELSRKRTVNYQSTGNAVGLAADLDDGEDTRAAVRELHARQPHSSSKWRGRDRAKNTQATNNNQQEIICER